MELRHLRYFVAVAEEMNIHRAAKRLNISQPPLSLSIQQLEKEIGAALFTREGRGIQITRAGEAYLVRARKILFDAKEAADEARQTELGLIGTLSIGFVSSSISGILQNTVAAHKKKYPNVALNMKQSVNSRMHRQIQSGDIDLGIVRLPEDIPSHIAIEEIKRESWLVALPKGHRLIAKAAISIKDLDGEPLIFYPRHNSPAGYVDVMELFKANGIEPYIVQEAMEQMTIAGLVASGMGVGIVPECMAQIKIPNVVHRPLKNTKNRTGFAFIHRGEDDVLVKNFIKEAKALG